jgi:hypothetical protein
MASAPTSTPAVEVGSTDFVLFVQHRGIKSIEVPGRTSMAP